MIGFEHTVYNVSEAAPSVQVCISVLNGILTAGKSVECMIESTDDTAEGNLIIQQGMTVYVATGCLLYYQQLQVTIQLLVEHSH